MGLILCLEFGQGVVRLSELAKPLAMGGDERDIDQGWWLAWTKVGLAMGVVDCNFF